MNKTKISSFFIIQTDKQAQWWVILLLILIAYSITVGIRYSWVNTVAVNNDIIWQDNKILLSPDSYWYATGVRDILAGSKDVNKSPIKHGFSKFGAMMCKITNMRPEQLLFYLAIFITPLLVIPMVLLGALKKMPFLGFFSSIIALNSQAIHTRTSLGVFDTDIFALIMPVFIIYIILLAFKYQKVLNTILLLVVYSFSLYVYPNSGYINFFILLFAFIYLLLSRKLSVYNLHLIQMTLLVSLSISPLIKLTLLALCFFLFYQKLILKYHYKITTILLILTVCTFVPILFNNFIHKYDSILQRKSTINETVSKEKDQQYTDVNLTISELHRPTFNNFIKNSFGNKLFLIIAVIGILLLMFYDISFLLFVPLMLYGFSSLFMGFRFISYMIPALSLGLCYFLYFIVLKTVRKKYIALVGMLLITSYLVYLSMHKTKLWVKNSPVYATEIEKLAVLDTLSNDNDYIVSWWDYGYYLKYYTGMNTVADGGEHHGELNTIISKIILGNSQKLAVNLAAEIVDYNVDIESVKIRNQPSIVNYLLEKYEAKNLNDLYKQMREEDFPTPMNSSNIYLYFPFKMVDILPTIGLFSDKPKTNNYFLYITQKYDQGRFRLRLGKNVAWDQTTNLVYFENVAFPLKFYVIVDKDEYGEPSIQPAFANPRGVLSVIFLKDKNTHIIVNDKTIVSNFFQIGILNNYKPELMEQVINNDLMKVYKVK